MGKDSSQPAAPKKARAPRTRRAKAPAESTANGLALAMDAANGAAKKPLPTSDEIRVRAYELYIERGCIDGRELEDWVRAEVELQNR